MPEKDLEKRLRTLEIRGATLLGSIATLAVCCVAFLGFEYYQIPNQVEKQIKDIIGQETNTRIEKALANADKLESKILNMKGPKIYPDVSDGDTVYPPEGTNKEDWVAFISPSCIGFVKDKPLWDNALLNFESRLDNTQGGWKVIAKYRYTIGGKDEGDKIRNGKANVLLIPSLNLKSSDWAHSSEGCAVD
jgi:hypothetical protein